jgi:hypothetical protein
MKSYIAKFMLAGSLFTLPVFCQSTPAPATKPVNTVNARRVNQQQRVAQGVKSGQLSAKETAQIENREHKINQEVHADRAANGGKLSAQERTQVTRQQNRVSHEIYVDKHNGQTQPR